MRKFLVLVFILAFAFALQAQTTKAHFREATWGMTQAQIKALEKGGVKGVTHSKSSGLDVIVYEGVAGGLKCRVGYYFAENQLVEGRYLFAEEHANRILFISDFKEVKEALTEKYEEPAEDMVHWFNDLYKDDPLDWGMAVAVGHLWFEAEWHTSETKIMLQLRGDNYKISHFAQYTSKIEKYEELVRKAKKKAKKGIW